LRFAQIAFGVAAALWCEWKKTEKLGTGAHNTFLRFAIMAPPSNKKLPVKSLKGAAGSFLLLLGC
jgi:hypothetical protein